MHQTLYRKYRPKTFDDVCGQEHITKVLRYEAENERFNHAYLFFGSRGTGKTTCAKILAKVINCEHPVKGNPCCECEACRSIENGTSVDVIEMDAASNTGVDNVRDIRDNINYTPAALKKKVYIIDEVHMLSGPAFNALLKTLEEPPEHAVFILATTELHKLPATIVSRCLRFDFHRLSLPVITERLLKIAKAEGISVSEKAAQVIAREAQGGMRDAISLFELCSFDKKITEENVQSILGISGYAKLYELVKMISERNLDAIFHFTSELYYSSKDIAVFWNELQNFYRDLLVVRYVSDPVKYLDITEEDYGILRNASALFTPATLMYQARLLDETAFTMNQNPQNKRWIAEMALIKMCDPKMSQSYDALLSRIDALELRVNGGLEIPSAPVTPSTVKTTPSAPSEKVEETPKPSFSSYEEWKTVDDMSDLLSAFASADSFKAPFLSKCGLEMTADKRKARVVAGSEIVKEALSAQDTLRNLRAAFVSSGLTNIAPEILFRVQARNEEKNPLSEFEQFSMQE